VIEHVADRQRRAVVGELGNVLPDLIVERELAIAGEEQHRGRGELFRHRACFEDGVAAVRDAALEIGQAEALLDRRLAIELDADGTAGRGARPLGEHGVD
jgi:hypothetical protein